MADWLWFPNIKEGVLLLIAVYGAALSTFNWIQSMRKERRVIGVSLETAMPKYPDGRLGPCLARIVATNKGHRAVTIKNLAMELPEGGRLFVTAGNGLPGFDDTPLPAALNDGQSAHLYVSYHDIGAGLLQSGRKGKVTLRPVCYDSVGGTYRGTPWEVDPAEFLKM